MKPLFKIQIAALLIMTSFFLNAPMIAFAQDANAIPGKISGNYGTGKTIRLNVKEPGEYKFRISNPDRRIGKNNIVSGLKFINELKILILDEKKKLVGSNFYAGNASLNDDSSTQDDIYMEVFFVNIQATGTYFLEISPLSPGANNKNFVMKASCTPLSMKIMGMDLEEFLSLVGLVVLMIFLFGYYKLIKVSAARMNAGDKAVFRHYTGGVFDEAEEVDSAESILADKCPKCGIDKEKDAAFCGECGTRFNV